MKQKRGKFTFVEIDDSNYSKFLKSPFVKEVYPVAVSDLVNLFGENKQLLAYQSRERYYIMEDYFKVLEKIPDNLIYWDGLSLNVHYKKSEEDSE